MSDPPLPAPAPENRKIAVAPNLAPDALAFQSDATEIALRQAPFAARALLYGIAAFVALGVLWASLSHVDRVVVAPGRLTTEAPQMVLQVFESAMLRELRARPGDRVRKGDVLATLDPTFVAADSDTAIARLESLKAQMARLDAELRGVEIPRFAARDDLESLHRQLDATRRALVRDELAAFDSQLREAEVRRASAGHEAADVAKKLDAERQIVAARKELFERKVGAKLALLEATNRQIETERDLHRLQNLQQEALRQVETLRQKRKAFLADWRNKAAEELRTARQEAESLEGEARKAARRRDLVELTAPADAIVLALAPRSVGSVAKEGETLLTLVPLDSPLHVTADLDSRDIALVRAGDPVTVKLEALPFQRHGTLRGTLKTLSPDTLERASAAPGTGAQASSAGPPPAYRAVIGIEPPALRDTPPDFRLLPGMAVQAEIRVGERRVISYFLHPLLQARDESLREP